MDLTKKRKLKEMIRGLISDGFSGTQGELAATLKRRGIRVTQSTVSRTMNQMGVVREAANGKLIYKLRARAPAPYRGSLTDLVVSIAHNGSTIVIRTTPGSAMFVAGFLDHECRKNILGTVAGDDTIFAAPVETALIDLVMKRVQESLRQ